MSKKHHVEFAAHRPIKEEAVISFQTKNGPVAFKGHKEIEEPVIVSFEAKNKRR